MALSVTVGAFILAYNTSSTSGATGTEPKAISLADREAAVRATIDLIGRQARQLDSVQLYSVASRQETLDVLDGGRIPGAEAQAALVVVARGSFVGTLAKVPPGADVPTGNAIAVIVRPDEGYAVNDWLLGDRDPEVIAQLGTPTPIPLDRYPLGADASTSQTPVPSDDAAVSEPDGDGATTPVDDSAAPISTSS